MNLSFKEIKCPCCGEDLEQGNVKMSHDVQMVKRCSDTECDFWMIIIIPAKDLDYTIHTKRKED